MTSKISINVFNEMDKNNEEDKNKDIKIENLNQEKIKINENSNPIYNSTNVDNLKRGPKNNFNIDNEDSLLISRVESNNNNFTTSMIILGIGLLGLFIISSTLNDKKKSKSNENKELSIEKKE